MKATGVTLFVEDLEASTQFYVNLFEQQPIDKSENTALFEVDGFKTFLHRQMKHEAGMPANEDHMEYKVSDLDEIVSGLIEKGMKIENHPKEYYWGRSAFLRDIEGKLIELYEK